LFEERIENATDDDLTIFSDPKISAITFDLGFDDVKIPLQNLLIREDVSEAEYLRKKMSRVEQTVHELSKSLDLEITVKKLRSLNLVRTQFQAASNNVWECPLEALLLKYKAVFQRVSHDYNYVYYDYFYKTDIDSSDYSYSKVSSILEVFSWPKYC
jgi:hypothetical protein